MAPGYGYGMDPTTQSKAINIQDLHGQEVQGDKHYKLALQIAEI